MVTVAVFFFRIPLTGSVALLVREHGRLSARHSRIGLFISSLAKTQQQAILGTFSCMVPMMLLSGFASPVENMPDWLQYVTLANPVRHFIVIVKGVFLKAMPARRRAEQPLAVGFDRGGNSHRVNAVVPVARRVTTPRAVSARWERRLAHTLNR